MRYGSLHGNIMGLEVVLADGTVLENLNTLRKDNTGYDLKQLFIGSEGTLGIITRAAILTPPKPKAVNVAFLACTTYQDVLQSLNLARASLGEILSAFEFLDEESANVVLAHLDRVKYPLDSKHPFYIVVETSGSCSEHDQQKMESFLTQAMNNGYVVDGIIAQDGLQQQNIWLLRESIAEALTKAGACYKYDLSIPQSQLYAIVEDMRNRVGDSAKVMGYGHVGDANIHLNISAKEASKELLNLIEPFVYEWTTKRRGSISAEHGLGLMKANKIGYSKSEASIDVMRTIKTAFDPQGILNPYKVLPYTA